MTASKGATASTSALPPDPSPLRKAAILIVSLEEPLAAQLLGQIDAQDAEAVTLEVARLDRVDPREQRAVLEEFCALGARRRGFRFDDVVRLDDRDIREAFREEEASTWATALAGVPRPVKAKILGALPPAPSGRLRDRLARQGPVRLDDVETAQQDLAERLRRLHDHGRISLPDPNGQEGILV